MTRPRTRASARFAATSPPPRTPPGATPARPPPPPGDPVSFRRSRPRPRRRPPLLVVQTRRDVGRRRERPSRRRERPRDGNNVPRDKKGENDRDDPTAAAIAAAAAAARRNGGGAAAASAAGLRPRVGRRAREGFRREPPRSRRLGTEARAVATPSTRSRATRTLARCLRACRLFPLGVGRATRRARASRRRWTTRRPSPTSSSTPRSAVANGFETTGPTTRACATAVLGMRARVSRRLAPCARAAGNGGRRARRRCWKYARASRRWRSARGRWRLSRAPRFPRLRTVRRRPRRRRGVSPRWLARRRRQTPPESARGSSSPTRLLCASAQPYLAATHAWIEEGALDDVAGEFFVREGEARGRRSARRRTGSAGSNSGEDGWANPSVPSFSRRAPRDFRRGEAARLMRAEDRPGWIAREDSETGSREGGRRGDVSDRAKAPVRRAVGASGAETARVPRRRRGRGRGRGRGGDAKRTRDGRRGRGRRQRRDASRNVVGGVPLATRPGVALDARFGVSRRRRRRRRSSRAASRDRPRASPRSWASAWSGAGHRFDARRLLRRRRVSTRGYRRQRRRWRRRRVRRDDVGGGAVAPARARAAAVGAALMARLRGRWRLRRCLESLRAVYLGGAGEATASFSAAVFRRLDARDDDPLDPAELNVALAEAIAADESGTLPTRGTCPWRWRRGRHPDRVRSPSRGRAPRDWRSWRGYACAFESRGRSRSSSPRAASSVTRTPARFSCCFARGGRRWWRGRRAGGPRRRDAPRAGGGGAAFTRVDSPPVSTLRRRAARTRRHARAARVLGGSRRGGGPRGDAEGGEGGARGVSRRRVSAVPGVPGPGVDAVGGQTRGAPPRRATSPPRVEGRRRRRRRRRRTRIRRWDGAWWGRGVRRTGGGGAGGGAAGTDPCRRRRRSGSPPRSDAPGRTCCGWWRANSRSGRSRSSRSCACGWISTGFTAPRTEVGRGVNRRASPS